MLNEKALFNNWKKRYNTTEANLWGDKIVANGLKVFEQKIISQYLSKKGKVLNLGCGGGREALSLARTGHKITGIDLSPKMIEMAKKNAQSLKINHIDFQIGNACNLNFLNEEFDYVIALEKLLNHIPQRCNRLKALREIRRVLKTGGYLIAVSNSINGRKIYQLYFKIINLWHRIYNPRQAEQNDIVPFRTKGKFKILRQGPLFHWYSALEFIDDLTKTGFKLVDFLSAREIELNIRDINSREKGGQICYIAQK